MAKKTTRRTTTTTTSSHYPTVKLCAIVGLIIAGVAGLLSFIFWLLGVCGVHIDWANKLISICNLVSRIALFVTVWLAAWDYVKFKNKTWKIIYVVFLVLSVLSFFGLFAFL